MPTTGVWAVASAVGPRVASPKGTTESGGGETLPTCGERTAAPDVAGSGVHERVTIATTKSAARARSPADHHLRDLLWVRRIAHSTQLGPEPRREKCDRTPRADVIRVMDGADSSADMSAAGARSTDQATERFTTLYRQHHARVRDFAQRRVGSAWVDEVVAETFLVAWRRIGDVPDLAVPWLYRVALYEIANLRRRQAKSARVGDALRQSNAWGAVVDDTDASDLLRAVAKAFDTLKPRDQEILRLAAWEHLTMAEGAAVLACSVSAYRMRLQRARGRLAAKAGARDYLRTLRDEGPEPGVTLARAIGLRPHRIEGTELAL
jgi:RNA polymerase sigma factor (sigma-70 family)